MRHSIKRISKSALSVILALMMIVSTMVVGIVSTSAASETGYAFNKQYLYVDTSLVSSATVSGVNYYWDDNCSNYGGWYTTYDDLGNNIYRFDLSGTGNSSYLYFRGFKIVLSTGQFNIAVNSNSSYNCVKVSANSSSGTWTTYTQEPTYYVAGTTALVNAANEWQPADENDKMTKNDDGTYSITYSDLEPKSDDTYRFKITTGSWENTSYGFSDVNKDLCQNVTINNFNNDGNVNVTFDKKSNITISFNPTTSKITVIGTPLVTNLTIDVAARYQSYNNNNQAYNAVSSALPSDLNATYTVNEKSSDSVPSGDAVTLAASTKNTDKYKFVGWYTDSSCTQAVELTQGQTTPSTNTTYYALYQQETKSVTFNVVGNSTATVNDFTNGTKKNMSVGTEVTVTPSDVTGYTSNVTVNGATLSGNQFTVGTANVTVTATYTINNHYVTFATLDNGTFTSTITNPVDYNKEVSFVVTPNAGYEVDTVTFNSENATIVARDDNGVVTAKFTMPDEDVTVSATFTKKQYGAVDNSDTSKGHVNIKVNGKDGTSYVIGNTLTFEPVVVDGYKWTSYTITFANGSTKVVNNGDTYSLTIDSSNVGNISVAGSFTEESYAVTFAGDNCSVPANATAKFGSTVTIDGFTANSGYQITGYTVTKTGDPSTVVSVTDNSFTMPAYPVTITAVVKKEHTVTVTSGENGSVSPTTKTVLDGETVTLTATPNDGYAVDTWTLPAGATLSTGTLTDKQIVVTITDDVTINVSFKESQSIGIYVAYESNSVWGDWETMSVKGNDGTIYTVESAIKGSAVGKKSINGKDCQVTYLELPGECANWTSFQIGNAKGGYFRTTAIQGAPQYGYCYISPSDDGTTYSCAATTISNPKANDYADYSCFLQDNPTIDLTATVVQPNTSTGKLTAGGTTYSIVYTVTDADGVSTEIEGSTWTPTKAGVYTISAKLTDGYTTFNSLQTAKVTVNNKTQSGITYTNPEHGSIKVTNASGAEITSAYEGDKVTVTVTPETGYKCTGISFTPNVSKEYKGNGVYEFTMPGEPVSIRAFISAKDQYTVTAVSNDETKGTVSPASKTVYEGDSVTLKATATGTNVLSKWEITGTYEITSGSLTDSEITIVPTSDVSATAKFTENQGTIDPNLHFVYGTAQDPSTWNKSLPVYKLSSGEHVVRFNVAEMSKGQNYFGALSSSESYLNMYWTDKQKNDFTISSTDTSLATASYNNFGIGNKNYQFAYFKILKDLSSLTMRVGTDGPLYELQPESVYDPIPADGVPVYAKKGSKDGSTYFGTTVATAGNTSSTVTLAGEESDHNLYYATKGSVVKITTTMTATVTDRYVHAFVINGKTYAAHEGTNNSYYTEFPVEEGVSAYEVTPIYYVNDCKTKGKYITFYVDASEIEGNAEYDWGNTIASYAYYYKNKTNGDGGTYRADGDYPGQPMLYNEGLGRYYCRVPLTMGSENISVSGITINNYKNDTVHATLNPELTKNDQSYDFNDFKIISDFGYDIIRFDLKPRNYSTLNKTVVEKNEPFNYDTYKSHNGWDDFVDNNGAKVDVLGNPVDPTNTHKLRVVSTASYNISGVGEWAVKYFVYDEAGTLITSGLPSDFIARPKAENNTPAYNKLAGTKYVGAPTEITFESRQSYGTNGETRRMDGRWYYAKSDSSVSADVKYRTSEDGTTYGKPQTNTSYATVNGKDSVTFETHGNSIYLSAMPIQGYVFSHWSLASGWSDETKDYTSYRDLPTTLGSSFTTTLDAESHYVANYVKAQDGNINISHVKYDASDAKGGMGYYFVEAYVVKQDGTTTPVVSGTGSGANGQSITLSGISSADDKIVITITTTTAGDNTFRYWYTTSSYGYEIINDPDGNMTANGVATEDPYGTKGTVTYTFETDISKLFSDSKQLVNELHFYSDIAPVSKEYKLTYKYFDRFGSEKSYVVTGKHDDLYYTENNNSWAPNEALIYEKAPAIDDLYKNCKWTMTNCSIDGTDATLVAEQVGKKYDVRIYDADGSFEKFSLPMNSYVKTSTGKFFVADATNSSNQKFLYWSVMEDGKEVARHYYQEFTRVILGNCDIIPVYGEKAEDSISIAEPQYSREQSTNEDGTVVADKLYVDFMVAYMSASGDLIRDDTNGTKYQSGILIEISQNNTLVTNPDGTINPDYSSIKFDSDQTQLETAAQTANGTTTKYTYDSDRRKVFNYTIDNSDYNNMNRFDYFVYFKNTDANQKYVMKAYYYVIVDGKIMMSEPVYFNLYQVGNSTPTTGSTTVS